MGTACIDTYEASVWQTTDATVIAKIKDGTVTLADLTPPRAVQHGASSDDYDPGCPDNPAGCTDFYAVSIAGVTPSRFINWFQSAAACRNSNKRLPANAEWQVAAFGTPDPGTCNVSTGSPTPTGGSPGCTSDVGTFDMVGNLWEWVADWDEQATVCDHWSATFGDDLSCVGGDGSSHLPGALFRGGGFVEGTDAGVFAVNGRFLPSEYDDDPASIGFRCAR